MFIIYRPAYVCVTIKVDFKEIGCGGMDWIQLAQNMDQWMALVNTVIEQWGSMK
jgi:hypothetical protein